MAAWLFPFSLNTFETEKEQVIAFATTDCSSSAECACLFNVLVFQFLHSLPVFAVFLVFYTQLASHKIEFWFKVKSFILTHTLSTTFVENYGLLNCTLYWQTVYFYFHFWGRVGRGYIWFHFWGFWFVVLYGNWEEVELAIYNLLFQSETFLWCRALIEIKSCSLFSSSQPLLNMRKPFPI